MVAVVATLIAVVLAVVLVTRPAAPVTAAAVTTTSAAPSSLPSPSASATRRPGQPKTRAGVKKAAAAALDDYAFGQYGQFWDVWSSQAQKLISRKDYQRRFRECPAGADGVRYQIQQVSVRGDQARVQTIRTMLGISVRPTFDFVYQRGKWRYVPPAENQAEYRRGVDWIISQEKAAGDC